MSTNATTADKGTGSRPTYFDLGRDETGDWHVRDAVTGTVHIVHPDGSRNRKVVPFDTGALERYMDAVAAERGWADRRYYVSLAGHLGDVVSVVDE